MIYKGYMQGEPDTRPDVITCAVCPRTMIRKQNKLVNPMRRAYYVACRCAGYGLLHIEYACGEHTKAVATAHELAGCDVDLEYSISGEYEMSDA